MKFIRLYIFIGCIIAIISVFKFLNYCKKPRIEDPIIRANELTRELSLDSKALKRIYETV